MHALVFLDPGHFHAALTLRVPHSGVSDEIVVYASPGSAELPDFLALVERFHARRRPARAPGGGAPRRRRRPGGRERWQGAHDATTPRRGVSRPSRQAVARGDRGPPGHRGERGGLAARGGAEDRSTR